MGHRTKTIQEGIDKAIPVDEYLVNPDTKQLYNSEDFDLGKFLDSYIADPRLLDSKKGRKELCKYNPLLFCLTYLPHMFKSEATHNQLTLNDLNLEMCRTALEWCRPKDTPKAYRHAFLAPRGMGKSTTTEALIIWSTAYLHTPFVLFLSGSDTQATQHLENIKREFQTNELLKNDFHRLTEETIWAKKQVKEIDRANVWVGPSQARIEARSITSSILGAKVGTERPSLIILDDVGRAEGQNQTSKQLELLLGTVFPLNMYAPVLFITTVHTINSPEDQMRRHIENERFEWVEQEKIDVRWLKPLIARPDGTMRSVWAGQWSVDFLLEESTKVSYSKNFLNVPLPGNEGVGWTREDFVIGDLPSLSYVVLSIDPSGSAKGDAVGVSVVGFSQAAKQAIVLEVAALQLSGLELKKVIIKYLNMYSNINAIIHESNMGGEAMAQLLYKDLPIPVKLVHATENKLVRAEKLLSRYQLKQIIHAKAFPSYEYECLSFPRFSSSPGQVDSVGQAIEYLATAGTTSSKSNNLSMGQRRI